MNYRNNRVITIIPARNEGEFIGQTLESLTKQDMHTSILVVNDGSEDKTKHIALKYKDVRVVDVENRGFDAHGTPILATVINRGLDSISGLNFDYIMILGADHILPSNYISTILKYMDGHKDIAICSGQIKGEHSIVPRGSGRIVRRDFWKRINLQYPVNFGFETYLLIKAQQFGYKIQVLNELLTYTNRPTRSSYKKETYISYGKSLKALGYSSLYSIFRIGLISLKNPNGALYMIKGYRSKDIELYEQEFRTFLKKIQHKRIKKYLMYFGLRRNTKL